jgi:hypothetical protein
MNHDPKRPNDRPDEFLEAHDPVDRSALSGDGVESALDEIGAEITSRSRPAPRRMRRLSITKPRTALLIGFATIGIGAAVAGGSQLGARTGEFQPTPQEIAKASPEKAKRLKAYVSMGGPGEFLNPAAPDFRAVALQVASDIRWPDGYESWRDFEISQETEGAEQDVRISSGALHGWFVMSAFCGWVLDWRHANIVGDTKGAAQAAQVISEAPNWKAVRDEDPHPDPTVPGDMGTTKSTLFGWMLPYRDAVLAGDRARVEHLLLTGYYQGVFQVYDPDWRELEVAHGRQWSPEEGDAQYKQYLASRNS